MTEVGNVYGQALYALARDEKLSKQILQQLRVLADAFGQEPAFLRLLSNPSLTKETRCQIIDDSFRGKIHGYVLNFLKILSEKGYTKHFPDCVLAYQEQYNRDNGILPVQAITAIPLTAEQSTKLTEKLARITGKTVELTNRVDTACMGGVRLEYDGKCMDDTVSHRLESVRSLLKNTVL